MTITAEDWVRRIEEVLDKFNLSKEEYWKDPDKFYENIKMKKLEPFMVGKRDVLIKTLNELIWIINTT